MGIATTDTTDASEWDLPLAQVATLRAPRPGLELYDIGIGVAYELISLWSDGAIFYAMRGLDSKAIELAALGEIHDRLPRIMPCGGRILVWCPREHLTDGYGSPRTPNAWLYAPSGEPIAVGSLGDAINHALPGPDGSVWVGYFDEGALSGGELEQHGLVRFDGQLRPVWMFPNYAEFGVIADCYALNVDEDGVATFCAYDEWNIVQIIDGQPQVWTQSAAGADSVIWAGSRVALVGGYSGERDRVCWLELDPSGVAIELGRGRVTGLPESMGRVRTMCRGGTMHAVLGHDVYRAHLSAPTS